MCDVRGCKQKGTKLYFILEEKWVKGKKMNYIKSFLIKRMVCATCFYKLVNNRQGGDRRLLLGGY
jgi:hypothetical protein